MSTSYCCAVCTFSALIWIPIYVFLSLLTLYLSKMFDFLPYCYFPCYFIACCLKTQNMPFFTNILLFNSDMVVSPLLLIFFLYISIFTALLLHCLSSYSLLCTLYFFCSKGDMCCHFICMCKIMQVSLINTVSMRRSFLKQLNYFKNFNYTLDA